MAPNRLQQAKKLLKEALELDPRKRADFLAEAYAKNDALREEVESLMTSLRYADSALETWTVEEPNITAGFQASAAELSRTQQIGPYRILQELGHGGMGVVYEAEQEKPVQRRVALKLIKWGMDTKAVIGRFESERQALAMMNHPNIARVYDAGATKQGCPYFAMELVRGEPITTYCDKNRLTVRERLNLFIDICEAVQHAHQKGIIHRDIKPSNILVTIQNNKSVPKIIDFGVAKATSQRLTERTVFTELGQMIGTPEYMSPEQAEMTGIDIDTRTDVYSLGVLLYELLVGTKPFDDKALRQTSFDEMRRRIREEEPPKPSTRVSHLGETSTTAARNRQIDKRLLQRELHGDLDWITMKALEKDRTRRYISASELAADIKRHLKHEPVLASPPSTSYRARKFIQRHRIAVIAGAAVILTLIGGIIATSIMALIASEQRELARNEAARAKAINGYLQTMLRAPNPFTDEPVVEVARETKVVDILDKASEAIDTAFPSQPQVEADLRTILGQTYEGLGLYDQAEPHLKSALEIRSKQLGTEHKDTLHAMDNLASLYQAQGRYEETQTLLEQTFQVRRRTLGDEHPDTLYSMEAQANLYILQGEYDRAKSLLLETLEFQRRVLGSEHSDTLNSTYNLASIYWRQGDLDEAERFCLETLEIRQRVLGDEHPETINSMHQLALIYLDQGRYEEAEQLNVKVLEKFRHILGDEHPWILTSINNLALLKEKLGRFDEAQSLLAKTVETNGRLLGEEHPETLTAMSNLAKVYQDQGRIEEAESLFIKTLEGMRRVLGIEHSETLRTMNNLASLYRSQNRCEKAEPIYAEAAEILKRVMPADFMGTGATLWGQGRCLEKLEHYEEAEAALLEAHDILAASMGEGDENTIGTVQSLVDLYQSWGKPQKAAEYRRIFEEIQKPK